MIKKTIIVIISIIIGVVISMYLYSFFREKIQDIFLWSTSNRIEFTGKNFYLFGSDFYHFSFTFSFLVFNIESINNKINSVAKNIIFSILLFNISVILISSIDANIKIIECTTCENGTRSINWSEVNYSFILGISSIISVLPNFIRMIMKISQLTQNTEKK